MISSIARGTSNPASLGKRILLVSTAANGMTNRMRLTLEDRGHFVYSVSAHNLDHNFSSFRPDLIIAPFLKTRISKNIYTKVPCWIVHPGPVDDIGAYSIDNAILGSKGESFTWGVNIIQAAADLDAGESVASASCNIPPGLTKSEVYNMYMIPLAVLCVMSALSGTPTRSSQRGNGAHPRLLAGPRPVDALNAADSIILSNASDGQPGVSFAGCTYHQLRTRLGNFPLLGLGLSAGAVSIGRVKIPDDLPTGYGPRYVDINADEVKEDIYATRSRGRAYVFNNCLNGAMTIAQSKTLCSLLRFINADVSIDTIVVMGSRSTFGNGINLNEIELSGDPAECGRRSIRSMNSWIKEILFSKKKTMAVVQSSSAAGGFMASLAFDWVLVAKGAVLVPHYRFIHLYGSDYWTYSMTRRTGGHTGYLPDYISGSTAVKMGLADDSFDGDTQDEHAILIFIKNYDTTFPKRAFSPLNAVSCEKSELQEIDKSFDSHEFKTALLHFVYKHAACRTPFKVQVMCVDGIAQRICRDAPKVKAKLVVIMSNEASSATRLYVKNMVREGFNWSVDVVVDEHTTFHGAKNAIDAYNNDETVHGIIVQLPFKGTVPYELLNSICNQKDVDHLGYVAQANSFRTGLTQSPVTFSMCKLLETYNIKTRGKSVLLIGLGLTANLQVFCSIYRQAIVTVANEHTPNLIELLLYADIIISAAGVAELVKTCKVGAVVIDIGLSMHPTTGKLVGDVLAATIEQRAGFYAPRMGTLTCATLIKNTLTAAFLKQNKRPKP